VFIIEPLGARSAGRVVQRARRLTAASRAPGPPFPPERLVSLCGVDGIRRADGLAGARWAAVEEAGRRIILVDRAIPPRTPQWNGAIALALAHTLLAPAAPARGPAVVRLAEVVAAEILLPGRVFGPIARRTDLTMDGLRDLAFRFSAPIRLTVLQWLLSGVWGGFALLWCREGEALRLRWRAASPGLRFPPSAAIGASAAEFWASQMRLHETLRTGRPHHGVEQVWTAGGARPRWWFTRFGAVRDEGARAVLALVVLERGRLAKGIAAAPSNRRAAAEGHGRPAAPRGRRTR
jgi:hypothetical protein